MNQSVECQVLIAGAGPAGLTLAIELARRGVTYRIVDRRDEPFHGSRGKGIQPRTLEIFNDLGVVDRILGAGGAYPPQWIHALDGGQQAQGITVSEPSAAEPYGQPWMVMQARTEEVLRERLGELGGSVEWGTEILGFSQADTVSVRLRTSRGDACLSSQYLVGADGGRSTVRKQLDVGFPGKTMGVRAIVADLHMTGIDTRYWHRFNDGAMDRHLSLCPLQGTDLIQLQATVPLEGEVAIYQPALQTLIEERSGRDDLVVTGTEWASLYQMNARLADHYRVGRVFLVGDAAHIHPPTGGQGLNTSIQDAYNLGWKLSSVIAGAPDALLDSYEEERRPIAEEMLGLSRRLLADTSRGEMRRGRETHQLDIGYSMSSLCLEVPSRTGTKGVRAGDRAPDAHLSESHGQDVRLFDRMRGTHWTLVCFESDAPVGDLKGVTICSVGEGQMLPNEAQMLRDDAQTFRDKDKTFQSAYAAHPGDWFLIRPDGYVGAILGPEGHHLLKAYRRNF